MIALRPFAALSLLLLASAAAAQIQQQEPAVELPLTAEQDARFEHFTHELRCLVCQNQTIAESQAPLAMDLREQVRKQIASGKSDADVVAWLTTRYGEYVLYRPRLKPSTLLLWIGPFLLVLVGIGMVWRYARRPVPASVASAPDAQALQALLAEHSNTAEHRQP